MIKRKVNLFLRLNVLLFSIISCSSEPGVLPTSSPTRMVSTPLPTAITGTPIAESAEVVIVEETAVLSSEEECFWDYTIVFEEINGHAVEFIEEHISIRMSDFTYTKPNNDIIQDGEKTTIEILPYGAASHTSFISGCDLMGRSAQLTYIGFDANGNILGADAHIDLLAE